jgi:hypothetical protein
VGRITGGCPFTRSNANFHIAEQFDIRRSKDTHQITHSGLLDLPKFAPESQKKEGGFCNPPIGNFVSTQTNPDHRERERSCLDHSFSYGETHGHQLEEHLSTSATLKALILSLVELMDYLLSQI